MAAIRASGDTGALRVGHQWAATLGEWTLAPRDVVPREWAFEARVTRQDEFWFTQRPIDLVLAVGTAEWVWRGVEVEMDGRRVAIVLRERPIVDSRVAVRGLKEAWDGVQVR